VRTHSGSLGFLGARLLTNGNGRMAFLWSDTADDQPGNVFVRVYDPVTGQFGNDQRVLSDPNASSHDLSGYYDNNGMLHLGYLLTQIVRTSRTETVGGQQVTIDNLPTDGRTDLVIQDLPDAPQNPIDDQAAFIRQQYLDFLGREPDAGGLSFYLNMLNGCAPTDVECKKYTRGALSANFFRSPEFQRKGSYVMYMYMVSLGQRPSTVVELGNIFTNVERPHYFEFINDLTSISDPTDDPAVGEAKKVAFTNAWMQRAEVQAAYPSAMANWIFIQKLINTADLTRLSIQNQLVNDLDAGKITRAQALRAFVESPEVNEKFYKQAFVTMEYFGYLRRDPEVCAGSADPANCGYIFHNNRFQLAADEDFLENTIVRGFIESPEYRGRFGP
jgi:hypothetical protein